MRVKVNVDVQSNQEYGNTLDVVIGPNDTVAALKDRVGALMLMPFPNQVLKLASGESLPDKEVLYKHDIEEGSELVLEVSTSAKALEQQLKDLLKTRDLSCDELGLLYCYKYGVSVSQTMQALGEEGKLQDFLKRRKDFLLEGSRVSLVREDTSLRPFSVKNELVDIILSSPTGKMDVKELADKFSEKFNMSIATLTGVKLATYLSRETETFSMIGRNFVGVKGAARKNEAQAAPATRQETCDDEESVSEVNKQYLELHSKVCSRAFNSKAAKALVDVVDLIQEVTFLNVARVVKSGSMGKGTAISVGMPDAEVVLFVRGLPLDNHSQWLPSLLQASAKGLETSSKAMHSIEGIHVTEDSVRFNVPGVLRVDLRFSPLFENMVHTLQVIDKQHPEQRHHYKSSLVEARVQFVARQPGSTKLTIRLLKWWRDQQDWSAEIFRPSDDIVELIAIYSAVQTKPADQQQSIANVMSLMSRFDELRIVWSNFYNKADVWPPLLQQCPLLMDPANPYVNIADSKALNPRELMAFARSTHFFW
mmetsp:Transcript_57780/g.102558  ORF Transcript_57780/g.102558 Transcript_57780/m.102558 type:complete len:536 (+) Transcript_57780:99-1706(+)